GIGTQNRQVAACFGARGAGTFRSVLGPPPSLTSNGYGVSPGSAIQQEPVASIGEVAASTTAAAMSSGGCMAMSALRKNSFVESLSIPVSVVPGQMAWTAIPSGARLGAIARISPTTPCLPIVQVGSGWNGRMPAIDAVATITPSPAGSGLSRMARTAA